MDLVDKILGREKEGGTDAPPDGGGNPGGVDAAGILEAAGERRGPGRPRKTPKEGTPDSKTVPMALSLEEINRLYEPKNYRRMSALYFDFRYVTSGFRGFQLTAEERDDLAAQMALLVKVMIRVDPKYIALLTFASTFGGLIASKELQYRAALATQTREEPKA